LSSLDYQILHIITDDMSAVFCTTLTFSISTEKTILDINIELPFDGNTKFASHLHPAIDY